MRKVKWIIGAVLMILDFVLSGHLGHSLQVLLAAAPIVATKPENATDDDKGESDETPSGKAKTKLDASKLKPISFDVRQITAEVRKTFGSFATAFAGVYGKAMSPELTRIADLWFDYKAKEGSTASKIGFAVLLDPSLNGKTSEEYKNHKSYTALTFLINRHVGKSVTRASGVATSELRWKHILAMICVLYDVPQSVVDGANKGLDSVLKDPNNPASFVKALTPNQIAGWRSDFVGTKDIGDLPESMLTARREHDDAVRKEREYRSKQREAAKKAAPKTPETVS